MFGEWTKAWRGDKNEEIMGCARRHEGGKGLEKRGMGEKLRGDELNAWEEEKKYMFEL